MTFGSPSRIVALLGILVLTSAGGVWPAFAAPADVALLNSYVGNYSGSGSLSGPHPDRIKCRMVLQTGNANKVNYTGRCSVASATFSLVGTMAFIDSKNQFEAAMSSSAGVSGVAIGHRQSGGVIFSLKQHDTSDGNDRTISSSLALSGGTLKVDFTLVDTKTGDVTSGVIPFARSQ